MRIQPPPRHQALSFPRFARKHRSSNWRLENRGGGAGRENSRSSKTGPAGSLEVKSTASTPSTSRTGP